MGMVKTDSQYYTNIANTIREKIGIETQYKPAEMPSGINEVYTKGYEGGKNSVVQRYATHITLPSFNILKEESAILDLDNITDLSSLISVTKQEDVNTTVKHLTINCPNQVTNLRSMLFIGLYFPDYTLEHLTLNVDTQKATSMTFFLYNLKALETVDGEPINATSAQGISIYNNVALKDIRFVKETIKANFDIAKSPLLSDETIQNIIDGLADLTGQTAQTLTVHKDVGGKLTDEQKATVTSKNWILAY